LEQGVEEKYSFVVNCERSAGKSTTFHIPSFDALKYTKGLSKQSGFIVVEASTDCEIMEDGNRVDLTPSDPTEVSSCFATSVPVSPLFVFKFLVSSYALSFKSKRHDDLNVTIAEIRTAHFFAFCSSTGVVQFELVFDVRNTHQQYLRLEIPQEQYSISRVTLVNKDVKPAVEGKRIVLIPLQKTSKKASASSQSFEVRLSYFSELNSFQGERGTMSVHFPFCPDIPINSLYITVHLPLSIAYGEFSGDATEVDSFERLVTGSEFRGSGKEVKFCRDLVRESVQLSCDFKIRTKSFWKRRWLI